MSDLVVRSELARELAEVEDESEQLDLFAEPETEGGKAKMGNIQRAPRDRTGSKNKFVLREAERLVAMYGDPRERMLAVIKMHTADLAALLKCTMSEALDHQRLAFMAVAPFVVRKQPVDVNLSSRKLYELTINEGLAVEIASDQGLGDVEALKVGHIEVGHDEESDGGSSD